MERREGGTKLLGNTRPCALGRHLSQHLPGHGLAGDTIAHEQGTAQPFRGFRRKVHVRDGHSTLFGEAKQRGLLRNG